MSYSSSCVCEKDLVDNCAHYLSNWMIERGTIDAYPAGCGAYCEKGRPIRAKKMRDVYVNIMGLTRSFNAPGSNCYIYCERNSDHQGHVYYGTKSSAAAGKTFAGADYYEYYT